MHIPSLIVNKYLWASFYSSELLYVRGERKVCIPGTSVVETILIGEDYLNKRCDIHYLNPGLGLMTESFYPCKV